jgi:hypothetical protein
VPEAAGDDAELEPPPCARCGSPLRPDVVWFGEMLPEAATARAWELARRCDVLLVVGTSGMVWPAAELPSVAKRAGAFVIEVNPEPSGVTRVADVVLRGPAGEVLPILVERVAARGDAREPRRGGRRSRILRCGHHGPPGRPDPGHHPRQPHAMPNRVRRTKIVCTLGPASWSPERISSLISAGMDVARINFSHGDLERHAETIRNVRGAADRLGRPVAILATCRARRSASGRSPEPVVLKMGDTVTFAPEGEHSGDELPTTYPARRGPGGGRRRAPGRRPDGADRRGRLHPRA